MTDLAASFEACRRVTRARARSFYFASHVLPAERRKAAFAIYAFCRAADDAVDAARDVAEARVNLRELRGRLDEVYSWRTGPAHPIGPALVDTVRRYGVERAAFEELLVGMEQDLVPARFRTTGELLVYCHRAAGVVGHLMMPVLGAQGAEARARAADLGVAMQLTNILRDVGEDLSLGRIYLPEEELRAYGLSHADVEARRTGPAWSAFMAAQVDRARGYYARADRGMPLIRAWGGRLCARVMRAVYGDILRELEAGAYDSFAVRHATGTGRKVALLAMSLVGWVPPTGQPRSLYLVDGPLTLARTRLPAPELQAVSHG